MFPETQNGGLRITGKSTYRSPKLGLVVCQKRSTGYSPSRKKNHSLEYERRNGPEGQKISRSIHLIFTSSISDHSLEEINLKSKKNGEEMEEKAYVGAIE